MSATPVLGPRGGPAPALVVLGVLASDAGVARAAAEAFAERHGGVDLWMAAVPFDQSAYYEREMGRGLVRAFCTCARLVAPDNLTELKAAAWGLEQQLMDHGRRRANLDPGVLDHTKLVLASFKPGAYKLYLGDGVWADTLLVFVDGAWRALLWTFADIADPAHLAFFTHARKRYKELLREWRRTQV